MLHKLTLNGFAVHRHRVIDFENGLTSIVGANGVGKSLIVEAVRYALFGTAALRGGHPDKVELEFSVRDVRYRVTRGQRDAKIAEWGGPTLAVGTKPTNQKIIELFGYGLDVFDVANCANQGLIEALSNMKPAERKRMIETTIGVDALEKLLEFCRKEASGAGKEADALARGMGTPPDRPEPPTDSRSELELASEVAKLEQDVSAFREAERNLALEPPPILPGSRPYVHELNLVDFTLEAHQQAQVDHQVAEKARRAAEAKYQAVKKALADAGGIPDYSSDGLTVIGRYLAAVESVDANPAPKVSAWTCSDQERLHDDLDEFNRWTKLHASGEHECPACHHTWPVQAGALSGLRDWHGKAPPKPTMTRAEIARTRGEIAAFERVRDAVEKASVESMQLLMERPYLREMTRAKFESQSRRAELDYAAALAAHDQSEHERTSIATKMLADAYDLHLTTTAEAKVWDAAQAKVRAWATQAVEWRATVEACKDTPAQLTAVRTTLMERQVYDRLQAAWETAMAGRAEREEEITSLRQKAEQWKEAVAAVGDVRQQIESHLVPGLAALSSILVKRMTGGRRQTVTIDPGFSLSLDNQDVNTLSGSEKAAVNLALRIALGRMLTSRVFSVLILDEPDAAMDDERAASTAECLRSLCPEIAQVILVTHKQIETDAQVVLN